MRLVATIAAISLIVIPSIAEAQQNRNRGGGYAPASRGYYNNTYRNNGNRYVQNNYYGGRGYRGGGWNNGWNNGGAIAAGVGLGLLGGLIGGALINQQPAYAAPAYAYPPPPVYPQNCVRQVIGYSQSTGQTITQVVCP